MHSFDLLILDLTALDLLRSDQVTDLSFETIAIQPRLEMRLLSSYGLLI